MQIEPLGKIARTHTCGALRVEDVGKDVVLVGWVHRVRDLGSLVFIDIRDRYGLTQVIVRDNEQLVAYSKREGASRVLVVVNLDPRNPQSGWVTVDPAPLGLDAHAQLRLRDRLGGEAYTWRPGRNFVILDPARAPAHVFTVA